MELEESLDDQVRETVFGVTLLKGFSFLDSFLEGEFLGEVGFFGASLFFGPEIHAFLG